MIHREAPEELIDLEKRFGLPNLRAIMIATEFFDINEEDLPNGRKRTIFRFSERYQLTSLEELLCQAGRVAK